MTHSLSRRHWLPGSAAGLLLAALAGLALLAAPARAQLPGTQLTSVFPAGGKAGSSVDVTIAGADMDDVLALVFNHAGITAAPKTTPPNELEKEPKPIAGQFVVQIAANVPPGVYEARAVGRFGGSNPRAFVVGALDELLDAGGNNSAEKAIELPLGTTFNGRVDANSYDYLKLTLKAGQRVMLDCWAQRIDSRMDPTLAVLSATGRELARVRDTEGDDPVLEFAAPADGTYVLQVFDAVYGGGADYAYRLTAHAAPHIDFILPPSGVAGTTGKYTVYGRNLPGGKPSPLASRNGGPLQQLEVSVALPGDDNARQQLALGTRPVMARAGLDAFEYRLTGPQGSSQPVPIYFARAPVALEKEPNNEATQANPVTLPAEFVGQFYPQADVDWVQFDAKKGEVWIIEVMSHQLGLNCDPVFSLFVVRKDKDGKETMADVAQVDDSQDRTNKIGGDYDTTTDDPSYRLTVNEDATYRLMIRDQFNTGREDPRYVYRLAIHRLEPDFRLVAAPEALKVGNQNQNQVPAVSPVVRKGGTASLVVTLDRRDDFQGEVALSVEGLPAGVTCGGAVLGGAVTSAPLVIAAAENAAAWAGPIRVIGKGQVGGKEVTREARYACVVWGSTNRQQQLPEFRLSRGMQLSVIDKETAPAFVQAGDDKVWETSLGGSLEVPVTVKRHGDFKDALKLTAAGLPTDIKPKELNIDAGKGDGKLEIPLNVQAIKPGAYTFYLRSDAKLKYARNPDAVSACENDQKQLADKLKELADQVKKLTADRDAANKAAQDAAAEVKKAEQAKDDKALAEAKTKAAAADEAKAKAEQALKGAQDMAKKGDDMKKQLDTKLTQLKQANQPKDVTIAVVSTPVKIRVLPAPFQVEAGSATITVKAGEKAELPVKIARMFGFADGVDVDVVLPNNLQGVTVPKVTVAKGQDQGKLEITTAKAAPVGEHTIPVRGKGKFNNVNVEASGSVTIKIVPAS